ncbi:MAG: hypothetical protein II196_07565, partial [Spirochaetales bacterium]|nr:hypothetical protein [Spirochaetales bacterium]
LEGDSQGLEVVLGILGIKARQGGVEESGVGGDVGQKLVAVAVVPVNSSVKSNGWTNDGKYKVKTVKLSETIEL